MREIIENMKREIARLEELAAKETPVPEQSDKVQLNTLSIGNTFHIGEHEFIVLEQDGEETSVISKGHIGERRVFDDETRDYGESSLREFMDETILPMLEKEGFFDDRYEYGSNVALWLPGFEDYTLLPLIYELDDRMEWQDPRCWAKANPGLGKIKKIKTLAENVAKAKRDPTFLPTLLTKDFNVPENSSSAWLSYDEYMNETVVDMEYLRKSYAIGGCDLSATTDLTCATLLIRKPNDSRFYVLQKYFLPKARVDAVEGNDKREAPYKKWAEQGWLSISDGATVDFHAVTEWFAEMVKTYNIRPLWIGYDAALSGYWREEMEAYGFDMDKIRQGPFTWTYPFKELAGMFRDHRIVYQNNPILRWCLQNTGVKSLNKDGIESQQPVKVSSVRRIDGTVSLLNAYTCFKNHEEEYMKYIR